MTSKRRASPLANYFGAGNIPEPPGLKPFWRYYGGKWRSALRYPNPCLGVIVEPFAGAAGYALRYSTQSVVLVDKDPVIAGLWRYLIAVSAAEIRAIPYVEHVDELPSHVPQEARWLVGFSFNSACSAPRRTLSAGCKRMNAMGRHYGWSEMHRERVATQVDQIRHWRIIEGDYTASPDLRATWFIDPPYQGAGSHYTYSSSDIDFKALGAWCRERRGKAIVCENEGASWLPFKHFEKARRTLRSAGSAEVFWDGGFR